MIAKAFESIFQPVTAEFSVRNAVRKSAVNELKLLAANTCENVDLQFFGLSPSGFFSPGVFLNEEDSTRQSLNAFCDRLNEVQAKASANREKMLLRWQFLRRHHILTNLQSVVSGHIKLEGLFSRKQRAMKAQVFKKISKKGFVKEIPKAETRIKSLLFKRKAFGFFCILKSTFSKNEKAMQETINASHVLISAVQVITEASQKSVKMAFGTLKKPLEKKMAQKESLNKLERRLRMKVRCGFDRLVSISLSRNTSEKQGKLFHLSHVVEVVVRCTEQREKQKGFLAIAKRKKDKSLGIKTIFLKVSGVLKDSKKRAFDTFKYPFSRSKRIQKDASNKLKARMLYHLSTCYSGATSDYLRGILKKWSVRANRKLQKKVLFKIMGLAQTHPYFSLVNLMELTKENGGQKPISRGTTRLIGATLFERAFRDQRRKKYSECFDHLVGVSKRKEALQRRALMSFIKSLKDKKLYAWMLLKELNKKVRESQKRKKLNICLMMANGSLAIGFHRWRANARAKTQGRNGAMERILSYLAWKLKTNLKRKTMNQFMQNTFKSKFSEKILEKVLEKLKTCYNSTVNQRAKRALDKLKGFSVDMRLKERVLKQIDKDLRRVLKQEAISRMKELKKGERFDKLNQGIIIMAKIVQIKLREALHCVNEKNNLGPGDMRKRAAVAMFVFCSSKFREAFSSFQLRCLSDKLTTHFSGIHSLTTLMNDDLRAKLLPQSEPNRTLTTLERMRWALLQKLLYAFLKMKANQKTMSQVEQTKKEKLKGISRIVNGKKAQALRSGRHEMEKQAIVKSAQESSERANQARVQEKKEETIKALSKSLTFKKLVAWKALRANKQNGENQAKGSKGVFSLSSVIRSRLAMAFNQLKEKGKLDQLSQKQKAAIQFLEQLKKPIKENGLKFLGFNEEDKKMRERLLFCLLGLLRKTRATLLKEALVMIRNKGIEGKVVKKSQMEIELAHALKKLVERRKQVSLKRIQYFSHGVLTRKRGFLKHLVAFKPLKVPFEKWKNASLVMKTREITMARRIMKILIENWETRKGRMFLKWKKQVEQEIYLEKYCGFAKIIIACVERRKCLKELGFSNWKIKAKFLMNDQKEKTTLKEGSSLRGLIQLAHTFCLAKKRNFQALLMNWKDETAQDWKEHFVNCSLGGRCLLMLTKKDLLLRQMAFKKWGVKSRKLGMLKKFLMRRNASLKFLKVVGFSSLKNSGQTKKKEKLKEFERLEAIFKGRLRSSLNKMRRAALVGGKLSKMVQKMNKMTLRKTLRLIEKNSVRFEGSNTKRSLLQIVGVVQRRNLREKKVAFERMGMGRVRKGLRFIDSTYKSIRKRRLAGSMERLNENRRTLRMYQKAKAVIQIIDNRIKIESTWKKAALKKWHGITFAPNNMWFAKAVHIIATCSRINSQTSFWRLQNNAFPFNDRSRKGDMSPNLSCIVGSQNYDPAVTILGSLALGVSNYQSQSPNSFRVMDEIRNEDEMVFLAQKGCMSLIFEKLNGLRKSQLVEGWKKMEWHMNISKVQEETPEMELQLLSKKYKELMEESERIRGQLKAQERAAN